MDRRIYLVFVGLGGMFLLSLMARIFPPTEASSLLLLSVHQLILGLSGALGSKKEVLTRPDQKKVIRGFGWGLLIFFVNSLVGGLVFLLASQFFEADLIQQMIAQERARTVSLLFSNRPAITWGMSTLLIVGAPLSEELFFRGLLSDLLAERAGVKNAVFFSALLFGVLHLYVLQFPQVFISGLLLGILFMRSRNIFVPVLAHAVVNGLGFLILLSQL